MSRDIQPVVVGRGMAGQAVLKSLAMLPHIDAELKVLPPVPVTRGDPLRKYAAVPASVPEGAVPLLFLVNPTGLHAQTIIEGEAAGFPSIVADKPVCVTVNEIEELRSVKIPVSILHGYRVAWGPQTIRKMIDAGEFGEVFAIESRYWQSSSAQMTLSGAEEKRAWKNDPALNGPFDALTDLGSHVADMILYCMQEKPEKTSGWITHRNALAPHRDTHVHLSMSFSGSRRALASISKTTHGSTNCFEFTVIGTKAAATWRFLNPDEIEFAAGNKTVILRRETANTTTGMVPFHGLGWLEGYAVITHQAVRAAAGLTSLPVPTLSECLNVMEVLLTAELEK